MFYVVIKKTQLGFKRAHNFSLSVLSYDSQYLSAFVFLPLRNICTWLFSMLLELFANTTAKLLFIKVSVVSFPFMLSLLLLWKELQKGDAGFQETGHSMGVDSISTMLTRNQCPIKQSGIVYFIYQRDNQRKTKTRIIKYQSVLTGSSSRKHAQKQIPMIGWVVSEYSNCYTNSYKRVF